MIYLGSDTYEVHIGDKRLILNTEEIKELFEFYVNEEFGNLIIDNIPNEIREIISDEEKDRIYDNLTKDEEMKIRKEFRDKNYKKIINDENLKIREQYIKENKRQYNKKELILNLFNLYYDNNKTKKEVYIQIAEELNIKWKSVQKTYLNAINK